MNQSPNRGADIMGEEKRGKITHLSLRKMKEQGEKIVALTAYDFPMARMEDDEGIELIEVAPGIDMEGQVLGQMAFRPIMRDVRPMSAHILTPAKERTGT